MFILMEKFATGTSLFMDFFCQSESLRVSKFLHWSLIFFVRRTSVEGLLGLSRARVSGRVIENVLVVWVGFALVGASLFSAICLPFQVCFWRFGSCSFDTQA
jgi:hypothetical protein